MVVINILTFFYPFIILMLLITLINFIFTAEYKLQKLRYLMLAQTILLYVLILVIFFSVINLQENFYFIFGLYNFFFGLDHLTLLFLLLTTVIFPICIFYCPTSTYKYKKFLYYLYVLEILLLCSFLTLDLFIFYVLFETSLIPMFIIIGQWGIRSRKIKAAYYFFFYTLFGSIFMFIALFIIFQSIGSFNILYLYNFKFLSIYTELTLWLMLFIPFAIKIPIYPFHLWLLEAHVEAPTVGSIILASLLLKLGSYAILRFLAPQLILANVYFQPFLFTLSLFSVFAACFSALRQIDIKRIIAYSSIAHMNLTIFGIYTLTVSGIKGSLLLLLGHGFVSAALFLLIGILYERSHTRLLPYFTGIVQILTIFSLFFGIFTFANISFPGTINFIAEFLIFYSIATKFFTLTFLIIFSTFFTVLFSIVTYNKIVFGNLKTSDFYYFFDCFKKDIICLLILLILTLMLGLFPNYVFSFLDVYIINILKFY